MCRKKTHANQGGVVLTNKPKPKGRGSCRRFKNPRRRGHNDHHVFSQTRFPELRDKPWNISRIKIFLHDAYHRLFKDMTPEEISDYLVRYFWNGYVPKRAFARLLAQANDRQAIENAECVSNLRIFRVS